MFSQKQNILTGLVFALLLSTSVLKAQFSVAIQIDQNISCHGGSDGILTAIVTPAGSYTFAWSNGGSTATISDLAANTYVVTVQNAAGGTVLATAILGEPEELVLTCHTELPLVVNPTGTVDVETTGGTAPYTFFWVNEANVPFSTEEDLIDALAGIYTQTATDNNGCTAVLTPVELVETSGIEDVFGMGARVFPNPASTDLTIETLQEGNIRVEVFNAQGQMTESHLTQGAQAKLSVRNWPLGWYMLTLPGLKKTVKVLVEH